MKSGPEVAGLWPTMSCWYRVEAHTFLACPSGAKSGTAAPHSSARPCTQLEKRQQLQPAPAELPKQGKSKYLPPP